MNPTRLGINKCGTGLWASEPVRRQTYAEVEWVTWDKAKPFTSKLSAEDVIRGCNLQDCEVLPLADPNPRPRLSETTMDNDTAKEADRRLLRMKALYHTCMSQACFRREEAAKETEVDEATALRREATVFEECAGWLKAATDDCR